MKYGVLGSGNYNLSYTSLEGNTWTFRQALIWNRVILGCKSFGELINGYINETRQGGLKIGSSQVMIRFHNQGNDQPIMLYPFTLAIKQRKLK